MKNSQDWMKGFTIFELLIVITIIGAIIIMGFGNYSGAQKRTRDTRRKSDLKQIRTAIELFRQDKNPPAYPADSAIPAPGSVWSAGGNIYMNAVPGDPRGQPFSFYHYDNTSVTSNLTYKLCACLENVNDPDGSVGDCESGIGYVCASGRKYELTQP